MWEMDGVQRKAALFKEMYPKGTRIELNHMEDPWAPVPVGTRGTVVAVDDIGQLHMKWDNGRSLAVVPGVDSFRKLTDRELEEERKSFEEKLEGARERSCSSEGLGKRKEELGGGEELLNSEEFNNNLNGAEALMRTNKQTLKAS